VSEIEDEIVEVVNRRLGSWIRLADQALMAEKTRVLRPFGLSVPQYAALHALSLADLSGAQLARVCCVTPQSMATMLGTLEGRELIARRRSTEHGTVMIASLTEAGRKTFEGADAAALAVEARLSAAFSDRDEARLRRFLATSAETLGAGDA
jgi:DNA-binding MarR family transcriptional regulator